MRSRGVIPAPVADNPQRAAASAAPRLLHTAGAGRRIRRGLGRFAVVALSLAAPSVAAAADGPEYFGTNLQTLGSVSQSKQAGVLGQLAANGLTVNRMQIDWDVVEPAAPVAGVHRYQWGGVDARIAQLAALGMRAAPLFRHTPGWVQAKDPSKPRGIDELPPARYGDFAALVAAAAARYGEGGAFWKTNPQLPAMPVRTYEIWNEVNLAEYAWNHDPNPEVYSALLQVIRPALKRVQPGGLLVGALAYQENEVPDYVPRMGAAGGLAALDAMGYHPYAPEALETIELVQHLRAQLDAAGAGAMPILANEAGQEAVVTNPDGSSTPNRAPSLFAFEQFPSDAARGANLAFAGEALAASDCRVEQFLPYSVSGNERDGEKLTEAYMGLFRPATGEPTLTAQALFRAAARWRARFAPGGPGAGERLALCGGGATPESAKLPIQTEFTGTQLGCVRVRATYDGNPLEAASLLLRAPDGALVAAQLTNALGEASACVPAGPLAEHFRASVQLGGAGRGGAVACDVDETGCPTDVTLRPAPGEALSAAGVTGRPIATGPVPPTSPQREDGCRWRSKTRPATFVPACGKRKGTVRLAVKVACDTAPVGRRYRFAVLVRSTGSRRQVRAKTVWLRNEVEQRFSLSGPFRNGHRLVLTYRQEPNTGIPQLRDNITLRLKKRRAPASR